MLLYNLYINPPFLPRLTNYLQKRRKHGFLFIKRQMVGVFSGNGKVAGRRTFHMDRILIAESNTELASQLKRVFADVNNYPMSCDTIKKTRTMLNCERWALLLIDEKMTDGSGLELLEDLNENIIVIMILAEDTKLSEVGLQEYGVADYIKKPFNPIVLKAKVGTQLQKKKLSCKVGSSACFDALGVAFPEFMAGDKTVYIDKYEFDFDNKEYKYKENNIMLGELEQSLLKLLVENRGIVLKKNTLMERLQAERGEEIDSDLLGETVQVLVEKLHAFRYIKTIFGIGYMWTAYKDM